MALISALSYLFIITALVAGALSSSLLQAKISGHVYDETKAFAQAGSALLIGENSITLEEESGEGGLNKQASYQFKKLSDTACGIFYAVQATGTAAAATANIESIFVFPTQPKPDACHRTDPRINPHRVMWHQIE
jgi:Tfp pilus assembly protein PilX